MDLSRLPGRTDNPRGAKSVEVVLVVHQEGGSIVLFCNLAH